MVRSQRTWVVPVLVATFGNVLGACTTYWLARLAVTRFGRLSSVPSHRAAAVIARYGQPALLLSWVPLIGDAIVAAAGAVRMPFVPFCIWTIIGKGARYAAVAWVALRV